MTAAAHLARISPRVGAVLRPQVAPERMAAAARAADAAGLNELWLWEDCFLSGGIAAAAIALSHSESLTVGVGVLPAPMRNVALTAMELATLHRAFPGRVRIGVGHGVQDWMAQVGEKVGSPMTLLREHLTCLAALLRGETVSFSGRYVSLDNVRLAWPPAGPMEILAAAEGPRTLQLSGELADGTVLPSGKEPKAIRDAAAHIATGRQARATPGPHSVVAYIHCAIGPTAQKDVREEISTWGFDANKDIAVYGTASEIAHAVHRWTTAGADTVVLQPSADIDIEAFVTFVGTDVQPLIQK